jgi:cytochrome c peroxidase
MTHSAASQTVRVGFVRVVVAAADFVRLRAGSAAATLFVLLAIAAGTTRQKSVPPSAASAINPSPPPSAASAVPRRTPSSSPRALPETAAVRAALGRQIFFDPSLSEPAGTSCGSCHDPAHGYAGNHGSKLGTALGSRPGHYAARNTPSVLYLKYLRRFHFHWEEDAPLPDAVGGFFWDGRVDSIAELARQPLLNPDEMGNRDPRALANKIERASYAAALQREFDFEWRDQDAVLLGLGEALEAFLSSAEMAPFSSRYDAYLRGEAQLNLLERRGLELFRDGHKGGCDRCHKLNDASPNPERSLFTDFGFEALGVPRNRKLPQNRDAHHYDLGLCGRAQWRFPTSREQWCGNFRTPSLRNVALRPSYMHNGAFTSLREVVEFYATRGITPQRWYGDAPMFDDVPKNYRAGLQVERVPYDRKRGQAARLNPEEIDAIVAFLSTLSDTQLR